MQIISTELSNCFLIDGTKKEDERGSLFKINNYQGMIAQEILYTISKKNVIRGMHYQNCAKLIWVSYGKILDVILCIDKYSFDFGKIFSTVLTENNKSLYIGKQYAHGFKVISDLAIVNYLIEDSYSSKTDKGIKWNSFGFDWKLDNPIMSKKDKTLPEFHDKEWLI